MTGRRSWFDTLRSGLTESEVRTGLRSAEQSGASSLAVARATREIESTCTFVMALGFTEEWVKIQIAFRLGPERTRSLDFDLADLLSATRDFARRFERTGLRLHGTKWPTQISERDFGPVV